MIVEDVITIDGRREELFALAQDYDLRLRWDPFLRAMRFLDGATEAAPGVRVWVRAWNGLTMEVEYLTVEPPMHVAMRMTRGPFLLEKFAGTWKFDEPEPGRTDVLFRYSFQTPWKALRPLLDPVVRGVFRRDVTKRLQGLKRGAEELGLLDAVRRTRQP